MRMLGSGAYDIRRELMIERLESEQERSRDRLCAILSASGSSALPARLWLSQVSTLIRGEVLG